MNPACQHKGHDELKKLGLFAFDARQGKKGAEDPEYQALITQIDQEVERIKAQEQKWA